ncbi:MAG: TonB-dependent receptor [Porticoccaceae bacterium]
MGMTITALSAETISEKGLSSLEDFANQVPGLVYSPSTTNTPIFTLRGVGFNESSLGVYPATSLYLDEAPLPFPVMASHTGFDLERVEVLKGPQGTLFGQNSTGGAINFIAAKPTEDFQAGGDLSYGRFDRVEMNGFVSGALTDSLNGRLAVTGANADDWQRSITRNDENGEEQYYAARLLLDYQPSDRVNLQFNFNTWRDKSDPQAQQLIAVVPGVPAYTTESQMNAPFIAGEARDADWSTGRFAPRADREFYQAVVRADIELDNDLTLTTLISYSDFEQDQATDGDGAANVFFDLDKNIGDIDSLNTEIRLANSSDDRLTWMIGANYEQSDTFEDQVVRYIEASNNNPANLDINSSGVTMGQDVENYAFFANTEYDLTSALTLKAGARYTKSEIDGETCSYASDDGKVADLFNLLGGIFGTVPFDPIGGYPDCFTLNYDGVPGELFQGTLDEDNTSWRVGLDYALGEDTLLYGNVSKGYKTGSFPVLSASGFSALEPVVQESVLAYELGMKTLFADGKVQLEAATFFYDYQDKQVRGKLAVPVFGIIDALVNVPESEIFGAEMNVVFAPTDELTLSAAVTYLDSEVKEYTGTNLVGETNDFSGDAIPFTPEWTYSANIDYRTPVASGGEVFFGAGITGQSDSDAAFGAGRIQIPDTAVNRTLVEYPYKIDDNFTEDARVGYETADQKWKFMLFGKNITDEYYWPNVIAGNESIARFAGRPVTYGIKIGYTY